MARFAGEFRGPCAGCDEYVEFAVGVRPGTDPLAMHFGPGGPQPVELRNVQVDLAVKGEALVAFEFQCPLCGNWSAAKALCAAAPEPSSLDEA